MVSKVVPRAVLELTDPRPAARFPSPRFSQTLRQQWLIVEHAAQRRIHKIVILNCRLDDTTLVPTMRKPFGVLAEGLLVRDSGGARTRIELFLQGVSRWDGDVRRCLD